MQQLLILRGLPGAGKSTFARKWVNEAPNKRVIVNRDSIRRMLGPYWVPSREKLVTYIEENTILLGLLHGYSVVVDATNFKHNFETILKSIPTPVETIIKDFTDVSVEECIERDSKRPKEEQVGAEVIINMAKKYLNYEKERNN